MASNMEMQDAPTPGRGKLRIVAIMLALSVRLSFNDKSYPIYDAILNANS